MKICFRSWVVASLLSLQLACGFGADLRLTPDHISARDSLNAPLSLEGFELGTHLRVRDGRTELRPGLRVSIGSTPGEILSATATSLLIRSTAQLSPGRYEVWAEVGGRRYRATPDLMVTGAGADAGTHDLALGDAMTDAGDLGGDAGDLGPDPDLGADSGTKSDQGVTTLDPACDSTDPDLAACYRFDQSLEDGSNHARHLTSNMNGYAPTDSGFALTLARVSRVSTTDSTGLVGATQATLSVSFEPPALGPDQVAYLADYGDDFGVLIKGEEVGDDTVSCVLEGVILATASIPNTGAPYLNVACIFDEGAMLVVEGLPVVSESGPELHVGEGPFYVGADSPSEANNFVGRIDDVRLWTRALSADEICEMLALQDCQ